MMRIRSLVVGLAMTLSVASYAAAPAPVDDTPAVGEVPRYVLMDPNGRDVSNDDFPDRFQLIAFGYTSCPDVCPTTLAEMAQILKGLGDEAKRVQAVFITVDPERDTPAQLKRYTNFFDARIVGLTGPPALIRAAADQFKVHYQKVQEPGSSQYSVDHTAGLYLLGPDGGFLTRFAYDAGVDKIVARIKEYLAH